MSDVIDSDGYRANVGIVLMNGAREVFLGRRTGGRGWQFPQGGVRRGEQLEDALFRELHEEVGLHRSDVELAGGTGEWIRYRLPQKYVRRNRHPLCIGQKQRWFLLRLKHENPQFAFDSTNEPEFDQWRWAPWWEPVREVIYFKRPVYTQALTELAPLAFPSGDTPGRPEWWDEVTADSTRADGGPPDPAGRAAASVE
jgi:putative (di)nucleoside polyphosphate hydrolase